MNRCSLLFLPALVLCAPSCTITTVNVSQKTALENQLLGQMAPLSEEELLITSVRSDSPAASVSTEPAVAARRRQLFNRDDTDELKRAGCLGEALNAQLVVRACSQTDLQERLETLATEENQDRAVLLAWFIAKDPTMTPSDKEQLRAIYHRLLVLHSPTGTPCEGPSGSWYLKPSQEQKGALK